MRLILTDQIPSGKNQMGVRRDGRHYAKKRFASWREVAVWEIQKQRCQLSNPWPNTLPMKGDIIATISYYPLDKTMRDLPGMQDALWHLLVYCGLIENDGQIKGVTWLYPWRTEGPCVEMEVRQA